MNENKKEFVEEYLQPMIKAADSKVKAVTYHKNGDEMVAIEYIGGVSFCINVTADSKTAIVKDVLKRIW